MFGRSAFTGAALVLLALVAVAPAPTSALYAENGDVIMLREDNFEEMVLKDDAYWMVEFFAPWCGHCQQLAPEYEKAAKDLKAGERAKLGAVNCDAEKDLCGGDRVRKQKEKKDLMCRFPFTQTDAYRPSSFSSSFSRSQSSSRSLWDVAESTP